MRIALVPDGAHNAAICCEMAAMLADWVGIDLAVWEPIPIPEIVGAEDGDAPGALNCELVVRGLARIGWDEPVLAITDSELCDCRGNPLSGAAQKGGRAGVISQHLIRGRSCESASGPGTWTDLLAWHVLHEVGHLAGMGHCGAAGCVMQRHVHGHSRINPEGPFCHLCSDLWQRGSAEAATDE